MIRLTNLYSKTKKEDGAALAMVLVFITVISLWMATLAVLTQTSTASLSKNTEENIRRAQIVNSVLPRAISELNYPDRLGMDVSPYRCNEKKFRTTEEPGTLTYSVPTVIKGETLTEEVEVECIQSNNSGSTEPVASFLLTGGMPPSGTVGVIGRDGGLKLDPGAPRLIVTGGITNVSGAWANVNSATLQLQKICSNPTITDVTKCENDPSPQVIQPSDAGCPANYYEAPPGSTTPQCVCPSWYSVAPVIGSTNCPLGADGSTFSSINPLSDATELRAYIDSISAPLDNVYNEAVIPTSCNVTTPIPGTSLYAVQIQPGIIDSSAIAALNNLTSSSGCGDGTTKAGPAVQFLPGVYRFNFSSAGTPRRTSGGAGINTFMLDTNGIRVIGGSPTQSAGGGWVCNSTLPGVQFQFQNASYMSVGKGFLSLCPISDSKPVLAAPWATGEVAPFYWQGANSDPIFDNSACGSAGGGANQVLNIFGQVFLPAGHIELCFNGNSSLIMSKGVVARAVSLSATGSAQSSGSVAPPRAYNGDRVVQLRFWSKTRKQDLGLVQVVIRDYFGRRQGAGYKIIAWRTIW